MRRQILLLAVLTAGSLVTAQQPAVLPGPVDCPYYGGDQGGTKYSPLTDNGPENVQRLRIAWQWKHWETPLKQYDTVPGFNETTPLMIDGVLHRTTTHNSITAVDAAPRSE